MKKFLLLTFALFLSGCTPGTSNNSNPKFRLTDNQIKIITPSPEITNNLTSTPMSQNITAVIHTSKGDIKVKLFPNLAPNTVTNFVGLSKGTKEWTDPQTGKKVSGTPLYQNVIFHRVIEGFMIQGGDPMGTGYGGPGYKFADEPVTEEYLRGTIAMANSGPNTNGSQFFIMHKDYPLPKNYTIFGRIDSADEASLSVVDAIATTETNANDRPVTDITIKSIDIIEN